MYKISEVISSIPKLAKKISIPCSLGGHYTIHLLKRPTGWKLFFGEEIGSEPIFRVHHLFKTRNEAIFYAGWLCEKSCN